MGSAISHQLIRKGKSMTILTVGIDLAKNVFAVHGVNEAGRSLMEWKTCASRSGTSRCAVAADPASTEPAATRTGR